MATAPMSTDTARMSFAKVAASGGKDNVALNSFTKVATSSKDLKKSATDENINPHIQLPASNDHEQRTAVTDSHESSINEKILVDAVKALKVHDQMPSLVVNGSGHPAASNNKSEVTESFSEDLFQRTDSGSELGTKPPSLDGKSITSGTTFALDEKDSLRPDDSASVKAAEDDDTFSGRGSIVAGSRIGSEAAARAYRSQLHDGADRKNMISLQEPQSQGGNTPPSGSSGQLPIDEAKGKPLTTAGTPDAFNLFYRQTPDEKLLEALESPKDRIFLLRLEQQVIEFVKDSKEPYMDLPPCNSFCRLLTHKLADYYHMTHQVDPATGTLRIYRTPFCRLPPSLTSISNPPTTGNTPPPNIPAMKIMRRGGDGDTGASASRANSENGSDGKNKGLSAKEKLSREEREAVYIKARERIFGKEDKTGEATPETEDGNEMSRSSSVSTKEKSGQTKRGKQGKHRRDDSDSFDVRSQYAPFFPQAQQQQPAWAPIHQYAPMGGQPFVPTVQNNFMNTMPAQYGPPQQFTPALANGGNIQPYNNMGQFPPANQRFQPQGAPNPVFGSPTQPVQTIPQQWAQSQGIYSSPYQQRSTMAGPQSSIPYAFGQLPTTANPADPKSQHPIPGSFNRHAFNPKTQSFVPGNSGVPVQQPMSHHGSPRHGSSHHGSPHLPYNNYAAPQPQFGNPPQFGNGMGYNMARQGSNNSLPSYHASPHMAHRPMMHQGMGQGMQSMSHGMPQNMPQGMPQAIPHVIPQGLPQGIQGLQPNGQVGSHLPNFGNSSTLPPKPPPAV
ncbi:R3H-containing protein-like protein [Coleophoma crateriformis]|uniref:R3H-containing protein-like protein n=1 Tax=Coleophoma crateriformis TaxID=565419 RepID=A0A3D8SYG4_9HELO|nr:R3H-containing protein-like protein [Coleophoma crateriformis]